MQYKSGRDWRGYVTEELNPLGVTVFDPYHKPFVEDVDEDEPARVEMLQMMEDGKYDELTRRMKKVRNYDLNLVVEVISLLRISNRKSQVGVLLKKS
jgi:hypothetical protein